MAPELSSALTADLRRFLRRILPGYVYVLLVAFFLFQKYAAVFVAYDGVVIAVLLLGGIVVGEIIYQIYHFVFGVLAWSVMTVPWGFTHIRRLRRRLVGWKGRYCRAFWDKAFFSNKDETQDRVLGLFSSAHGSAASAWAIVLALLTVRKVTGEWPHFSLVLFTVALLLFANHWYLCRDAGALEDVFLGQHWNDMIHIRDEYVNYDEEQFASPPSKLTSPKSAPTTRLS